MGACVPKDADEENMLEVRHCAKENYLKATLMTKMIEISLKKMGEKKNEDASWQIKVRVRMFCV